MFGRYLVVAAGAVACTGDLGTKDSGTDSGTCNWFQGPTTITRVSVDCTGSTVRFEADTEGWTDGGWVFSQETENGPSQWSDTHDLDSYEYEPCNQSDKLEQELSTGASVEGWQIDQSTVFTCADHYNVPVMTYAFGVKDVDGNLVDCAAFGEDVQGMISNSAGDRVNDPDFDISDCEQSADVG
ncbi:MAG: hypothetical protein ABMB14_32265 [Myxococcota bacterium]